MIKLPFFTNSIKKSSKFLTLEINANEIKCLCFYKDDDKYKILGHGKEKLEPGMVRNGVIIEIDAVEQAMRQSIRACTENLEDNITQVVIGITSDLCQETVTTAKITRNSNKLISNKEITEFKQKIIESAYIQVQSNYAQQTGNTDTDFELITSSVVYTKLDDQKYASVENQSGNVMELAVYTAFSQTFHIKTLRKLCNKLHLELIAICPASFALIKSLKYTDHEFMDLVTMQVGYDYTNVCSIFGGATVANLSLHIGKNHLTNEVGKIMGLNQHESRNVMESYIKGSLSSSEGIIIQNSLEDILKIWLDGIELLFSDFTGVKTFSPFIYLFGEGTEITEIMEVLSREPWTKTIPFKSPPKIHVLELSEISNIIDATGKVVSKEWLSTATLANIYTEEL